MGAGTIPPMPTPARPLFLALYCVLAGLLPSPSLASEAIAANGLNIVVSAVDKETFHLVAYPVGNPAPPVSPFVVETAELPEKAEFRVKATGIPSGAITSTRAGIFSVNSFGSIVLQASDGQDAISDGNISLANGLITITLQHATGERFYGAGNAGMNEAGDLTHPSGTSGVSNGMPRAFRSSGPPAAGTAWSRTTSHRHELERRRQNPRLDQSPLPTPMSTSASPRRVTAGTDTLCWTPTRASPGARRIPPRWTFGFMLSRWGYADAADVQDKWHQFRDRKIPWTRSSTTTTGSTTTGSSTPRRSPIGQPGQDAQDGAAFRRHPQAARQRREPGFCPTVQGWVLSSPLGTDLRFDIPASRYWWWSPPRAARGRRASAAGGTTRPSRRRTSSSNMTRTEWEG